MDETFNIAVDGEIFKFLQDNARPFIDTPNSVLRRLLLDKDNKNTAQLPSVSGEIIGEPLPGGRDARRDVLRKSIQFVRYLLQTEFKEEFERRQPYRFMYESKNYLLYFQNFNKENDRLWYRVAAIPFKELKLSSKKAFICLTNPAEKIAYLIPVKEIEATIKTTGWDRDYLEINIDHMSKRWIELDWNIEKYLKRY
jgi:hypothetical protein